MSMLQFNLPAGKADFNLEEAAALLGMSTQDLKQMVLARMGEGENAPKRLARLRFRPTDLIVLSMIKSNPDQLDARPD